MAAVRHFGFVMRVLEPLTKGFWWSLSLYKIWLESMHYAPFLTSQIWLVNAYSRPQNGDFDPLNGEPCEQILQRHVLARVRVV